MTEGGAGVTYADSYGHIRDELRRLDMRIRLRAQTLPLLNQEEPQTQLERTVYISPGEVGWLLDGAGGAGADKEVEAAVRMALRALSGQIDSAVRSSLEVGIPLALPRLADLFGLSEFELQAVVICLAPELRAKYDRLYAYLQDDITRKRPSVDLVLDLLCETEDERWNNLEVFSHSSALLRWGLLQTVEDPNSPSGSSGLSRFLRVDPRIRQFLLGDRQMDARLAGLVRLHAPASATASDAEPAAATALGTVAIGGTAAAVRLDLVLPGQRRQVLYLRGPAGVGRASLALRLCAGAELSMLVLDCGALLESSPEQQRELIGTAFREAALQRSALYLERGELMLGESARAALRWLGQLADGPGGPVIMAGDVPWSRGHVFAGARFETVEVPMPDVAERAAIWRLQLKGNAPEVADWAEDLAVRFVLTPARIRDAIAVAEQESRRRPGAPAPSAEDLAAACRSQSNQNLGDLAVKVDPRYSWDDLVLPEAKTAQLREICSQVRHHHRVYELWGFGRKLAHGKGLSALFAGPPGTGKTMAAEVLAGEVGLGLFKIDLSGVVSKYIGETEKNLSRIFREARTSNAILFFDEADALFGKRTEVADAHDRYANIETSYLLQQLDEHEGVVLLASNLRANLDEAFTRRIRYVVDFPFPDAAHRQRIWEAHFPAEAPVADDVDPATLAREFPLAGGNIKNIVLNAAFLAAADGGAINARHVRLGTRREFEKLGKLWNEQQPEGRAVVP